MPYLAFHLTGLPDNTLPDGRPIIRNVTLRTASRSLLCGGFVRNDAITNAQGAVVSYVSAIGGVAEDWEIIQVTLAEYDTLEGTVYDPLRAASLAAENTRKQTLRDLLAAQTARVSDLTGTDRVWRVPTTPAEAREFFRAMLLALEEVRDTMIGGES